MTAHFRKHIAAVMLLGLVFSLVGCANEADFENEMTESSESIVEPSIEEQSGSVENTESEKIDSEGDSSSAIKIKDSGADLITQQYAVTIPQEEKRLYVLKYDSLYGSSDGLSAGMQTDILVKGESGIPSSENMLFQVLIISDNWGPQGNFYSYSLGHPSGMEGSTVYILQPMFGSNGSLLDDYTTEYAEWITVF